METQGPVTVGVVTAYNPPGSLARNCQALLQQCSSVIVVDDGSDRTDDGIFESLRALGCSVVRLERNQGIASALNAGVRLARSLHSKLDFILTMDQDSLVQPRFVRLLEKAARDAEAVGVSVGMVAPAEVSGLPKRARTMPDGVIVGDEPVQSGLLIPVASLDSIGPFDEGLFIDGVDSEFYLRAKAQKLVCVIAPEARLKHSLGTMVPASLGPLRITWGGKPLLVRTAAPWRYYFIIRNRVLLARRYAVTEPYWAIRGVLLDVRHLVLVSILAPGRLERLSSVLRGLRDGLRGRTGPKPKA